MSILWLKGMFSGIGRGVSSLSHSFSWSDPQESMFSKISKSRQQSFFLTQTLPSACPPISSNLFWIPDLWVPCYESRTHLRGPGSLTLLCWLLGFHLEASPRCVWTFVLRLHSCGQFKRCSHCWLWCLRTSSEKSPPVISVGESGRF